MQWIQAGWNRRQEALRVGVLVLVAVTAIHNAVFVPLFRIRGIASSHVTALAAMEEPASFVERSPIGFMEDAEISMDYLSALPNAPTEMLHKGAIPRQVAQTSEFSLIVLNPVETADKIRVLGERMGGHLLASQYSGSESSYAEVSIRVPVADLDPTKAEIRKLALRVESENSAAEDATKEWVDSDARLNNLRAIEAQYLHILKLAGSVQDTLAVTGKLGEIRGQIEQLQAEFSALAKRVQTVTISVRLRADADVQVFGVRWQPLYRAKLSLRQGVDALGSYGATMFSVLLHIPVIALWLFTFFAFAAMGWRLLRWAARVFFGWRLQSKT